MNDTFKVIVNSRPDRDEHEIWLLERRGNETYLINATNKGLLVAKKVNRDASMSDESPFLRIQGVIWDSLVRAISGELPSVDREVIDAELKATKYHLEDMRQLMKLNRKGATWKD